MISQRALKRHLNYDPRTGIFTWKMSRGRVRAGDVAGTRRNGRSIVIGLLGKVYHANQLAWLYETGEWVEDIKHRDNNLVNNRFRNLWSPSLEDEMSPPSTGWVRGLIHKVKDTFLNIY